MGDVGFEIYEPESPPPSIHRVVDHLDGIEPPDWLIRSLIEDRTVGTMFGGWNVGKSALAVDIACRVACGLPFGGQRARAGAVLYVAQEGRGALRRRFRAWELHNNEKVDPSVYQTSIGIRIPDQLIEEELKGAVQWLETNHDSLALVVMDTASATMVGDQKHGADMNAYLGAIHRLFPESAVMLIHHPGHGDKSRGRGASELPAACDWEFQLERVDDFDNVVRLRNTKQRDAAPHRDIHFKLLHQSMGVDAEEEEFGSVVVEYLPAYEKSTAAERKPSPTGEDMLRVLRDLVTDHRERLIASNHNPDSARILVEDWRKACEKQDIKQATFRGIKARLIESERVIIDGRYVSEPDA